MFLYSKTFFENFFLHSCNCLKKDTAGENIIILGIILLQHVFFQISGRIRSKILIQVFILARTSVLGVYEQYHIFNHDPSFAYVNITVKITVIMYVINWRNFMKISISQGYFFSIVFHCPFCNTYMYFKLTISK